MPGAIMRRATVLGLLCVVAGCNNVPPSRPNSQPAARSVASDGVGALCDGKPADCVALGFRHLVGDGVTQDHKKAAQLFAVGCDGGRAAGCHNLAVMYDTGQGVAQSSDRAEKLFERACTAGDPNDCAVLGIKYLTGSSGVKQDKLGARDLFTRACAGGSRVGCSNLGTMYYSADAGLSKDKAKAAKLYMKACDGKSTSFGTMASPEKGGMAVGEARSGDDMFACSGLGRMYLLGEGGLPRDEQKAA